MVWKSIDDAIRERNKQIAAKLNEQGDKEKGSLARPETAHVRTVISKFGGTIRQGTAVAIPEQKWQARQEELATEPESHRSRHVPSHVVISAGIPGYRGHFPHAPQWNTPYRRADKRSPFLKPYLEAMGVDTIAYDAHRPHALDHSHLDVSLRPASWVHNKFETGRPVPGYSGHVPAGSSSYGTSHWREKPPVTRAVAQQRATSAALKRVMDSGKQSLAAPPTATLSLFEQQNLSC